MGKTRPKDIGTAAETAVTKVLKAFWSTADRSVLRGSADQGDIHGTGVFIWEIKGGAAAKNASENQIRAWLMEAKREAAHANVPFGILVTQRGGFGLPRAGEWWAWLTVSDYSRLIAGNADTDAVLRIKLVDFLQVLSDMGWVADDNAGAA